MTTTRLRTGAALLCLFISTEQLVAGAIDRFPLPRTIIDAPWRVAAGPSYAWVLAYDSGRLAKIGPDGTMLAAFPFPTAAHSVAAIAYDPQDGSCWYASNTSVGRISPTGEATNFYFGNQLDWNINDVIVGADDHIWVAGQSSIFRVSREGGLRQFSLSSLSLDPYRLTVGPDYNIWISFHAAHKIARITPDGALAVFDVENPVSDSLNDIVTGSDGAIWFGSNSGRLHKSALNGQNILVTPSGISGSGPSEMAAGTDGNLYWLSHYSNSEGYVTRFDPRTWIASSTHLPFQTYRATSVSASASGVWWTNYLTKKFGRLAYDGNAAEWSMKTRAGDPKFVAAGPEGSVWVVHPASNRVTKRASSGEYTEFTLPSLDSRPAQIVKGSDDAMWFTEENADKIGRISAAGVLSEYPVPTPYLKPTGITADGAGNLWFTYASGDKIGRLTTAGVFTEFPVGSPNSQRTSIAAGPDGNIWFTEKASGMVGRMTVNGQVTRFSASEAGPHSIISHNGYLWFLTQFHAVRMSSSGSVLNRHYLTGQATGITGTPDGSVWVSNYCCEALRRIGMNGTVYSLSLGDVWTPGLTAGGDGNLWLIDARADDLVRLTLDQPLTAIPRTLCLSDSNAYSGAVGSFYDPDQGSVEGDFSATIDWGDGTTEAGMVIAQGGGVFDVAGSHTYGSAARADVNVHVTGLATPESVGRSTVMISSTAYGNPGSMWAPVAACPTKLQTAMVADVSTSVTWTAANAQLMGTAGSTVDFRATGDGAVTLTATLTNGECQRTISVIIPLGSCAGSGGDFDGNGRAEIVWRQPASGANAYWSMDGTTIAASGYLPEFPDAEVASLLDADGDGRSDVIWWNPTSGAVRVWLMDGFVVRDMLYWPYIPGGWTLASAGDFNADARADLVIRNSTTNEVVVWLMQQWGAFEAVNVATPSAEWTIEAVGDFNADGSSDLLWRNSSSREAWMWLLDGGAIASAVYVASPHEIWTVQGVGDINGDGTADIIWRNAVSNEVVAWLMNGGSISSSAYIATPPPEWQLRAIADFDADGRADLMWRHDTTGDNAVWLLDGLTIKSATYITPVSDPSWLVVGPK